MNGFKFKTLDNFTLYDTVISFDIRVLFRSGYVGELLGYTFLFQIFPDDVGDELWAVVIANGETRYVISSISSDSNSRTSPFRMLYSSICVRVLRMYTSITVSSSAFHFDPWMWTYLISIHIYSIGLLVWIFRYRINFRGDFFTPILLLNNKLSSFINRYIFLHLRQSRHRKDWIEYSYILSTTTPVQKSAQFAWRP